MKKYILGASLLLSALSHAGKDQVPTDRAITKIITYEDFAAIWFTPNFDNTQNCQNTIQGRVIIDMKDEKSKEMYSAALAAATSGKKVGFGIEGCFNRAPNYPLIYRIDISF